MQYILTEEEMNKGSELIESWTTKIPEEYLQDKQFELHKRGLFTCVTGFEDGFAELKVYQKI